MRPSILGIGIQVTIASRPPRPLSFSGGDNMTVKDVKEEWDFYPCQVDHAPASISLNMWFEKVAPLRSAKTLYWLRIQMRDQAEHGMGAPGEAEILHPIEDALAERARAIGLYYVGRLRNDGSWQLA